MINPLAYTPIVDKQFKASMSEEQVAEFHAWTMAHLPMQRYGTVDECAGSYVYLASDLSTLCTGQLVGVDGGMTVTR
jgi:NAD(P)-dependent dehydrogenase (short-subunit alcohol dehydrogenase family)